MEALLSNFFVNPALAAAGGALVSSPIIIHIINRLRFRKVRFAAMEFLLQSQKKNRRRILMEQLLLLLLRILVVIGLVLLIARLKLSPAQVSILRGEAAAHHIILIDDSGSMREMSGPRSAFDEAKDVARKIVANTLDEPGEQRVSIYFLSKLLERKEDAELENKEATQEFLTRLLRAFDGMECTYQDLDLNAGVTLAGDKLQADKSSETAVKFLHVISDYRDEDWKSQTALVETVKRLTQPDSEAAAGKRVHVNFIRAAEKAQPNLAVTDVSARVETAAAGVPIEVKVTVKNFGERLVENIPVRVSVDGKPVRRVVHIDRIEPGEEESGRVFVQFLKPGRHRLEVTLKSSNDALQADNTRYVAIEYLPQVNRILLVDGDPSHRDSQYVADALAADPTISGIQVDTQPPDWLSSGSLERYQCVFLINVPQLDGRAVARLEDHVRRGRGLIWFLGERVQPNAYNRLLFRIRPPSSSELEQDAAAGSENAATYKVAGLFPVPLAPFSRSVVRDNAAMTRDLKLDNSHPVFEVLGTDMHFADVSRVKEYWPIAERIPAAEFTWRKAKADDDKGPAWIADDNRRKDGVIAIASVRNTGRGTDAPLILEHRLGRGTILTCLTAAGRTWTNWPTVNHYLVLLMQMRQHVVQKVADRKRIVGQDIVERLPANLYRREAGIGSPEIGPGRLITLDAQETVSARDGESGDNSDEETSDSGDSSSPKTGGADASGGLQYHVFEHTQTGRPGIYTLRLTRLQKSERTGSTTEYRMYAYNVPVKEGATQLHPTEDIRRHFVGNDYFRIYEANDEQAFEGIEPGQEIRRFLLFLMVGLLISEQALAYKLSYHTRDG